MRNILVTGASGFIGRNLIDSLDKISDYNVTTLPYDNSYNLTDIMANIDFVFHFAAVMRPVNEEDFQKVNVGLTESILENLRVPNRKTGILFTSSVQAESDNPYGRSKRLAEESVVEWSRTTGNTAYIYRLPNIFGKWSKPNYSSVVATFAYNIAHDLPIDIHDPEHKITLAHIDDVVSCFLSSLEGSSKKGQDGYYHIDNTTTISLREIADILHMFRSRTMNKDITASEYFVSKLLLTYNYFKSLP